MMLSLAVVLVDGSERMAPEIDCARVSAVSGSSTTSEAAGGSAGWLLRSIAPPGTSVQCVILSALSWFGRPLASGAAGTRIGACAICRPLSATVV